MWRALQQPCFIEKINELQFTTTMAKCKGCTNNCRLTINRFTGGRQFISGNRCERGLGKEKNKEKSNLFEYKNKLAMNHWNQMRRKEVKSVFPES